MEVWPLLFALIPLAPFLLWTVSMMLTRPRCKCGCRRVRMYCAECGREQPLCLPAGVRPPVFKPTPAELAVRRAKLSPPEAIDAYASLPHVRQGADAWERERNPK